MNEVSLSHGHSFRSSYFRQTEKRLVQMVGREIPEGPAGPLSNAAAAAAPAPVATKTPTPWVTAASTIVSVWRSKGISSNPT